MKRTTVKIPDELDAILRQEAERMGKTISEVTREALEAHLGTGPGRVPRRRLLAAGTMNSGCPDLGSRVEEILREEWGRRPLS
jgi:Arc/MetJ-type ribon-helix-helix transcriptional regulator